MTVVCCRGRCLGCCSCCSCCNSRRALVRRAQCRAVLPCLLILVGAGYCSALAGSRSGWMLPGAALCGALVDVVGRRSVLAFSVPLQLAAVLVHALVVVEEGRGPGSEDAVNGTSFQEGLETSTVIPSYEGAEDDALLAARLARSACAGAALGVALPASLFYIAELWRGSTRGAACCVPVIAMLAGRTLAYGLEEATKGVSVGSLVGLAPGCLGLLLLLLLAPPSPYWLAARALSGKRSTPIGSALARLRGHRDERGARDEAEDVMDTVREQRSSLCARNWRGPLLSVVLVGALPLSGLPLLESLLPAMLSPSGPLPATANVDDWLVRVGCGGALLLSVCAVAVLVDRCGRRPLLLAACVAMAAGHATLGYFHWFLGSPLPPRAVLAGWITLGAVAVSALAGASLCALAWLLLAEVLPMRTKAFIPFVALLLDAVLQFSVDALYLMPHLADDDDPRRWDAAWCWAHSLWCLVLGLTLAALLPETKGFNLAQLHEIFRGPNRQNLRTHL